MKQVLITCFLIATFINTVFAKEKAKQQINSQNNISSNSKPPQYITSFADIIEPLMPAVVNIYTVRYKEDYPQKSLSEVFPYEQFNNFFEQFNVPFSFEELYSNPKAMSLGSGFFIDEEGLIVTNHHVVADSDEIHIKLSDNTELPAIIIGIDAKTDLALLKISSKKKFPAVKFGNSSKTRVGDVVIAIGNPLGFGGTVTTGIISSKGRDLGASVEELVDDFIQIDAAINRGNSGGPLFNIHGEVIGINTSIPAAGGGTNIGIGFAIPSSTAQDIITKLQKHGKIVRGRLDIVIQNSTPELTEALGISNIDYGILVVDVRPNGSGHKAGIKRGDLIIKFNGNKVADTRKLQLHVADAYLGEEVKLTIIRNNQEQEVIAKIEESLSENNDMFLENTEVLHKMGAIFTNLSPALIEKFSLDPDSRGIMVIHAMGDEPPYDLKMGDIILDINNKIVNNINEFDNFYEDLKKNNKKSTSLLIKRDNTKLFIPILIK
ncbi:MAG: Do family serine endopeptidase [Rickettsiaceae bacterium]|nr:Do family serine endopeptidase [Rickettsiaceae bacterium]